MTALEDERAAHQVCVQMRDAAYRENERLRTAGAFLLNRLDDFEREIQDDELAREWSGHVVPAIARLATLTRA
jgi:hypothetical protein